MQKHSQHFHVPSPSRLLQRLCAACFASLLWTGGSALAATPGAVYVQTNQAAGNAIVVFSRAADGTLTYEETVGTGGTGTITPPPPNGPPGIDPLASQGSVTYHDGLLFAVNAGSNDISVFRAEGRGLHLQQRIPSGGIRPVSIAVRGELAYVVNAGGTPNIAGFRVDGENGQLVALPRSARPLPGGAGAAPGEVAIGPDSETVIVTEKGTGQIDTFVLDEHGIATAVSTATDPGKVPFGFAITRRGYVLVSEAGSGSASSFDLGGDGRLSVVSASVSLAGQAAPCWLVASPGGQLAFTADAGTQAISTLAVGADGTVSLAYSAAALLSGNALDLGLAADGQTLFVREGFGANGALPELVGAYRVHADGSLTLLGTVGNIPPGSQGLAVR